MNLLHPANATPLILGAAAVIAFGLCFSDTVPIASASPKFLAVERRVTPEGKAIRRCLSEGPSKHPPLKNRPTGEGGLSNDNFEKRLREVMFWIK
mmetsp:Transcript_48925/g.112196  ORF Transcript_48925/g.112196 Transcript_48925/m.112196 type:complete len:95 (+) Transcript_48925:31-315(+)